MTITLDHNLNKITIANTQLKVSVDKVVNLRQVQQILEELFHMLDPTFQGVKIEEVWDDQTFLIAEWR